MRRAAVLRNAAWLNSNLDGLDNVGLEGTTAFELRQPIERIARPGVALRLVVS